MHRPIHAIADITVLKAKADQQVQARRAMGELSYRPADADQQLKRWHAHARRVLADPCDREKLAACHLPVRQELLAASIDQLHDQLGLIGSDFQDPAVLQARLDLFTFGATAADGQRIGASLQQIDRAARLLSKTNPREVIHSVTRCYGFAALPAERLAMLSDRYAPRPVRQLRLVTAPSAAVPR